MTIDLPRKVTPVNIQGEETEIVTLSYTRAL